MAPTAKAARQTGKRDVDYAFQLAVHVPGAAPVEVEHTCRVPHDKLPTIGLRIPVTTSSADPRQLQIDFDRMPGLADRARAAAQAAQAGDASGAAAALGYPPRKPPGDES